MKMLEQHYRLVDSSGRTLATIEGLGSYQPGRLPHVDEWHVHHGDQRSSTPPMQDIHANYASVLRYLANLYFDGNEALCGDSIRSFS